MATTISYINNFLFKEIADKRVNDWPLMSSPWLSIAIILAYLLLIYVILPPYMEERKPYSLKNVMRLYNTLEVITNSLLFYNLARYGWFRHYTFGCQPTEYSSNDVALRMANLAWITAMLKNVQLIDTIFYVLRKKYNQVSFLHVYHHSSTVLVSWICAKYFPGGMGTFPWFINSFIHILMYSYYLLLSFPQTRGAMNSIKSKLTFLQIIQLIVIIVHAAQSLLPSCEVSSMYGIIMIPYIYVMLHYFVEFYYKSYRKKNV